MPVATASVTPAATSPPASGAPAGTSVSLPTAIGITATAISMSAVPDTIGVTIRRRNGSHAAMANWNSDDTTMRLANVARCLRQGDDRDCNEVGAGSRHQDVPGSHSPDMRRLQGGGDPGDDQRREDRPRQVELTLAGRPTMMVTIRTVLARTRTTP